MNFDLITVFNEANNNNQVGNRQGHYSDAYVRTIFCDVDRAINPKFYKRVNFNVRFYYDNNSKRFYLLKYDNDQKFYRKIEIYHYKFYNSLYNQLMNIIA